MPDLTLSFSCPACGARIKAPIAKAGRAASCPKCREPLTVPRPAGSGDLAVPSHDSPVPVTAVRPVPPLVSSQPALIVQQTINVTPPQRKWSPGVAALLSVLLPGLGQMYKGQLVNGLAWLILTAVGYVCLIVPGVVLHLCCVLGAAMGDPYR